MAESEAMFTVRKVGPVTVVRLTHPHISHIEVVDALGKELLAVLEAAAPPDVVLDFEAVTFLTSSFLGKVITLARRAAGRGGQLRLCGLSPRILEIFQITNIDRIVEILPSVDDAVGPNS